jgi:hypothetical protein
MGGIASAIIIPPSGSGLDRVTHGFRGEEAFRRVAAVQPIAPRREGAPHRQAGFHPDDSAPDNSARGRARDNREVRQLAIRPGTQGGANPRSGRAVVAGPGAAGLGTDRAGLQGFGGARFASIQFLAQVIGQEEESSSGPLAYHPDGVALGSDAYRRAGAAPPHYSEQPTLFRVAI